MSRILWLVFERPPHPDAVACPATEDDARLVLELLESPRPRRLHVAEQLGNYLLVQADHSPLEKQSVPCRRSSGLYQIVPWRLAKWLSHSLPATEGAIERMLVRIRTWLTNGRRAECIGPIQRVTGSETR